MSKEIAKDMTEGPVLKQLAVFAGPVALANALQAVYSMVDMVVVGQFVGPAGLSAVGIGGQLQFMFLAIGMGFSVGAQVLLSQQVGARDRDLQPTIGTLFTMEVLAALLCSVLGVLCCPALLSLLNPPPEAVQDATRYTIICCCGMIFIYGYNAVCGILRGMGESKLPMVFIAIASAVNLVLDLVFVAGLKMGPFGAALATVMGQGVSFIWAIIYLYRRREAFGFDFRPESFKPDMEVLPRLVKLGLPMCLQSAAISISQMFVNSFINSYGVVASAVTGVGNKLAAITAVVTNALSTAGASMVGQNIGAEKYDRIPRIIRVSFLFDMAFAILLSLITACFPRTIFGIFNDDPEVLDMAMVYVPVAVLLYLGFGMRSPFFALINGCGNAKLNLAVGLLDGVICRIGLALLLGLILRMGIMGFWLGNAFAGYMPFVVGGVFYLSGAWKTRKLIT